MPSNKRRPLQKIDCSQPPIFRKIVETEHFASQAAILDECQIYLGEGTFPTPSSSGAYVTKMAASTGERSILTI